MCSLTEQSNELDYALVALELNIELQPLEIPARQLAYFPVKGSRRTLVEPSASTLLVISLCPSPSAQTITS